MMKLEQDSRNKVSGKYQKPESAPVKSTELGLPQLPLGQVQWHRAFQDQAHQRRDELVAEMDVDDADLLRYEEQLLELKIWDDDEKTNKRYYQIKAISYDTADDYYQAH